MIFVTIQDDINVLHFTNRVKNYLRKCGVNTVGELLDASPQELRNIYHVGERSVEAIARQQRELRSMTGEFALVEKETPEKEDAPAQAGTSGRPVIVRNGQEVFDIPIEELGLPTLYYRKLKEAGLHYTSQLEQMKDEEILKLDRIGRTGLRTLRERLQQVSYLPVSQNRSNPDSGLDRDAEAFLNSGLFQPQIKEKVTGEMALLRRRHPFLSGMPFLAMAYDLPSARLSVKRLILSSIDENGGEITSSVLDQRYPSNLRGTEIIREIFHEMEADGQIRQSGSRIEAMDSSILDWVNTLKDERTREIFLMRLSGATQDRIGEKYGVTHQRINMLLKDVLSKRPKLREDRYVSLYTNYVIDKKTFMKCFGEPETTYYYVRQICPRGMDKEPLEACLDDERIPEKIRQEVRKYLKK